MSQSKNLCMFCNEERTEELKVTADGSKQYHQSCYRINKMETFVGSYGGDNKELAKEYFKSPEEIDGQIEIKKCILCNEDKKELPRRYKENAFLPVHDSCTLTATPHQKENATKIINNQKKLMEGISDLSKLNGILENSIRAYDKKKSEGPDFFGEMFPDLTRKEINMMIQGDSKDSNIIESNFIKQGREVPSKFINPLEGPPKEIKDKIEDIKLVGDEYQIKLKPSNNSRNIISSDIDEVDSFPCWFCGKHEGEMIFDTEFDTPLHKTCLEEELRSNPDNPEAQIMRYLLND